MHIALAFWASGKLRIGALELHLNTIVTISFTFTYLTRRLYAHFINLRYSL